ncbi:hypothetical protein CHCC20347_3318 [Bacillus paralicheniformis]|nr:hypothetical protein CHCC20348_1075 [Bacillus paralicheniformis]TWK50501.1 hypothetical protein CHCC20347_3318 [Bacillus paralicheniformis]
MVMRASKNGFPIPAYKILDARQANLLESGAATLQMIC